MIRRLLNALGWYEWWVVRSVRMEIGDLGKSDWKSIWPDVASATAEQEMLTQWGRGSERNRVWLRVRP